MIVRAGIIVVNRDGIEAVSMARVAAQLGVGTMSLYRYVSSKYELMSLMVDEALGLPPAPTRSRAGWRERLATWGQGMYETYTRNHWILRVPGTQFQPGPQHVAWVEQGLASMLDTPLNVREQFGTLLLIEGFARDAAGFYSYVSAIRDAQPSAPTYGAVLSELTDPARFPGQRSFPALRAALDSGELDGMDEFEDGFAFGLERILDGVDALILRKPVTPRPSET